MASKEVSLRRSLSLWHIVLFGLAYLAPMVVFAIYGIIVSTTNGLAASAYLVAMVAMFFTALSYGKMVKAFPVSGSAYTYTRKSLNAHLGFMVGWAIMLDYIFIPMAIWLIGASYLNSAFPAVPMWGWVLAFIVITTVLNILGIKLSANVNMLLMGFQFLVILLFIILSVNGLGHGVGAGKFFSLMPFASSTGTFSGSFSHVLAGAAIACYSFLGFDAVSTFTEETHNPQKTIPRAILLIILIGGVIFIVSSYFGQLIHPSLQFHDINSAAFEIASTVGGNLFSAVFLAGIIVAQFASGVSAQSSASRLLFAMGRDTVLPKRVFGYIHPRFQTPAFNILIIGIIGLLALGLSVSTSTSFINFGAFSAFTLVNISVIAHYFIRTKQRTPKGIVIYLIFPLLGAIFDFWLLINLDPNAIRLGISWAIIGFIYLLVLTRLFRVRPPEMSMDIQH